MVLREWWIVAGGVKKNQAGGSLGYSPKDFGLVSVYDMQIKKYRMINPSTTTEIKTNGKIFMVGKLWWDF